MRRRPVPRPVPASPKAPPSLAAAPKWLRSVILVLTGLVLVGWFASPVANPDTWWHLATGRYIWQTHHLPSPDPFAFTTASAPPAYPAEPTVRQFNLTHEWLAQLIFYLAWSVAGPAGLVLLRALMLAAFCALAGAIVYRRSGGLYRSVMAALAAAAVAGNFAADRPFLFTYLLLAVTVYLLETGAGRWTIWLLPPIFLFWANCHGGYFLGWVALAPYSLEALKAEDKKRPAPRLWIAAAASVFICGANPNGFRALTVTLAYRSSLLQGSLWEWQHPQLWPPDLFAIVLFLSAAALLWRRRGVRIADWILFAAFSAAALLAIRNTILIGWLGPILIASYVPAFALPVLAEFAAALLLIAAAVYEAMQGNPLRVEQWLYPQGAADFLLARHIPGPIFNSYEHGGYLMWRLWPEHKVFIDGRALSESVFHDYQRMLYAMPSQNGEKSGLDLLDQYGIQAIVLNGFEYGSGAPYLLNVAFADPRQAAWKLVYQDAQSMVFVRDLPPGVAALPPSDIFRSLESQCSTHIAHIPSESLCAPYLQEVERRAGFSPQGR